MHNGRVETLADAIRQHAVAPSGTAPALSNGEIADLVAFLHTLTDAAGERRPVVPPSDACPP
jgi:cytochrome c peroxidase